MRRSNNAGRIRPIAAQTGRVIFVAVVCAIALSAGRWLGFVNYYIWLDQNRTLPSIVEPGVEQLGASFVADTLVAKDQFETRFFPTVPRMQVETPGLIEWAALGSYLSMIGILSLSIVRWVPLWFAPLLLHSAPTPGRASLRLRWHQTVARSGHIIPIFFIALVVGFGTFIIDSFYTRLVLLSSYSRIPLSQSFSYLPRWGFVSYVEATILSASAFLIPFGVSVLVARRVFRRGHGESARLCWRCGYPRPEADLVHANNDQAHNDQACSECGARGVPTGPRRWRTRGVLLNAVILTSLAFALLYAFDRASPVLAYHVAGVQPKHIDPKLATHDLVWMRADVAYRVKRPDGTLWVRFNSTTEFGDDIATGTLDFVFQASPKAGAPNDPVRWSFLCDRENLLPEPAPGLMPPPAPGAIQRWEGAFTTPAGETIEWELSMVKGARWASDQGGVYLSPRVARSIKAVAPGDHPPFEGP